MEKKNAKIDFLALNITPKSKINKNFNSMLAFENLIQYINGLNSLTKKENYYDTDQVIFMDSCIIKDKTIFLMKFVSVKTNHVRDIFDTKRMINVPKKKKTPEEGDIENTHLVINFLPTYIDAYVEYSHFGARESKILQYLNDKIQKMYEEISDVIDFELSYEYYFDKSFSDMLLKKDVKELRKIELICEDASDPFLALNGRSEKYNKTIIYQPQDKGIPILKSEINDLYDDFNTKYSRIRIKNSKGATIIDTDQLKKKEIIKVELNSNKTVNSTSIFKEIDALIKKTHTN